MRRITTYRLDKKKPSSGDTCLVYLGHGWRELTFYSVENRIEGFYDFHGSFINPYNRIPVWFLSPEYPEDIKDD